MYRYLMSFLLAIALAAPVWAQDEETDEKESDTTQTEAEEQDDSELDDQDYVGTADDDFVPSEDIQADQSIAFPTDI